MSIQLVLDLDSLTEPELINKATTIGNKAADAANAALVTGAPYTGAQILGFATAFGTKRQTGIDLKAAQKANTTQKNTALKTLENALTANKKFFESKTGFTAADAQTLGFDIKADATPPAIVAPEDLSVTYGDVAGSVSGHWQPTRGTALYIFQYRPANTPGAAWVTGYTNTASDCRVTGLTPGALYEFQVCAVFPGVENPGPACSVVEHRAA